MTEKRVDELNRTYQLGQSVGLERAGNMILEDAAGHFKNGRDDAATILRQLGQRIIHLAKTEKPESES